MEKSRGKNEMPKRRKGDTTRTSNKGQKSGSGGRPETNNQGRPRQDNPQSSENTSTGSSGKIL